MPYVNQLTQFSTCVRFTFRVLVCFVQKGEQIHANVIMKISSYTLCVLIVPQKQQIKWKIINSLLFTYARLP